MRGLYNVYSDGELIASVPNVITDEGRRVILRYLAGNVGQFGGAVAVGSSQQIPASTDTKLYFEYGRGAVDLVAPDFLTSRIIFKAPLPIALSGVIYELGLYPFMVAPSSDFASNIITGFDPSVEGLSGGTANTANYRIGIESYQLSAAASGTTTATLARTGSYEGYAPEDVFTLGYFVNDANAASIRVRAINDASNYYSYTFTPPTVPGYYTKDFRKADFVKTGNGDWNTITSLDFRLTAGAGGTAVVQLDGLRVSSTTQYIDYALVSRAVLGAPIFKPVNQQMDIEYVLEFAV